MDVELPNGKVIQGVPEGTPKEEIMRKAIGAGLATEADFATRQQTQAGAPIEQESAAQPVAAEEGERPWYESVPQFVAARQLYEAAGEVLSGYQGMAQGESPLESMGSAISKAPTSVPAELAASMGSGAVGQALGGLAGIGASTVAGSERGAETVDSVSGALTYRPRAESTQEAMRPIEKAGQAWERLQSLTGGAVESLATAAGAEPGSPAAGAAYAAGSTIPDAVGMLVPASRMRKQPQATGTVEGMTSNIEQAGRSGLGRRGTSNRAAQALAEEVQPQGEVVRALEDVGIPAESVPPEVLSGNQAFREVAGTARSVPGSELSQRYRGFMEDLSRRADELSRAADADDIGTINARVEEGLAEKINTASRIEGELYDKVDAAIDPRTPVDVTPITGALRSRIDEVGGDLAELTPSERRLVGRFMTRQKQPDGTITYTDKPKTWSAISGLRKELNAARGGKSTFGDAASYELNRYGSLVSGTQRRIADEMGFGDDYAAAMKATGVKKSAQEAAEKLLGKRLDKSFSSIFEGKVKGLAKGRVKEFQEALESIPAGQRQQAVTSFVYDQIIDRRNMDPRANIAKYNAWYNQLQANPAAKTALYRNLPKQARQDIDALGKITSAVKRANEDKIATGRLAAAEEGFKLGESIVGKVGQSLSISGGGTLGGMVGGPAGSAAGAAAGAAMTAGKRPAKLNVAASEVLASPAFQRHVINVVNGQSAARRTASERGLANNPAWKTYIEQLPAAERRAINRGGITAWLTSQGQEEIAPQAQAQ